MCRDLSRVVDTFPPLAWRRNRRRLEIPQQGNRRKIILEGTYSGAVRTCARYYTAVSVPRGGEKSVNTAWIYF